MLNVLVLEGVSFIRLWVKSVFTKDKSVHIVEADNLSYAFELLESRDIDIVLLDIDLRNTYDKCKYTDGLTLVKALQTRGLKVPHVVVASGNVSEDNAIRAM